MLFTAYGLFGQTGTITGVVVDRDVNETLPGANVVVEGTTIGSITDLDGRYSFQAPAGTFSIVASFVGYEPVIREVTLAAGQTITVNFELGTVIGLLSEFVIVGYGVVRRADATGSIATVSSRDFNQGAITSAQDLLVGRSAGVVITSSGGAPGSGSEIRIRGGSSLSASNSPLIVIDGVPIENRDVGGSSNFLSFINPNDIESFTILKDASATAIYGSRASNGVIIITTKGGVAGRPQQLTYDFRTSISSPIKFTDVYSGDEIRQLAFDYVQNGLFAPFTLGILGQENTNWQREIFRVSASHDHRLTLTGELRNVPYRASLGYTSDVGILKNTDLRRVTASINLNPTLLNDALRININARGMTTAHNFGNSGAIGNAISMSPAHPIMDGNPRSGGFFQWINYGASLGTHNPVAQVFYADNKSNVNRFVGNIQFDYDVPFLSGLKANLNLAGDFSRGEGHNNNSRFLPANNFRDRLSNYKSTRSNRLLDFVLNYNAEVSAIASRFDLTAGYSWQRFRYEDESFSQYAVPRPGELPSEFYGINELQLISFFGRLNYSLANRYLLTVSVRNDHSSRFARDVRSGIFPSAAFAWRINEEALFRNIRGLSDLRLRLGWGITGQQDIGPFFPFLATYQASRTDAYYFIDGQFVSTLRPNAYDALIKWEETETQNIGLDLGLFNDRLTLNVDYYFRETTDLLNNITIPTGSNFANRLFTNVGSLENRGIEVNLNLIPISRPDESLVLGFNFSHNKNKITRLLLSDDPDYQILYGDAFTGLIQATMVGHPAFSFFVNQQVYDSNGNPIEGLFVDRSGEGGNVVGNLNNRMLFKNPVPDYVMGFSARYNYKNFDISTSLRANIGNYVYNAVLAGASIDQMYQIGYWRNQTRLLENTRFVKRQFTSDFFVENASFLRMDFLSLGYRIAEFDRGVAARVSFTVQNVFTVTRYTGLDPEVLGGVDNNFYPRPRTFMFAISLGI